MRIFVTGATGYIGSAVVSTLQRAGHEVVALTRSAGRAAALQAAGVRAVVGDLRHADRLREELRGHDAYIHLAEHEESGRADVDRAAIRALLEGAHGERPGAEGPAVLVYTSGVYILGDTRGQPADESTPVDHPAEVVRWRPAHERLVLDAADAAVVTAVIRPGMVYGGAGGLVGALFASAVDEGAATFVGDGMNRWSLVHRDDLAALYRLVVERRLGGIFHAVDEKPIPVLDLARRASAAAGRGGATRSIPLEEARRTMGAGADARCNDQVVIAPRSRAAGWATVHPPFTEGAGEAYEEWMAARG
jgi:nucleoside-diphosphate-sugar epimerase